MDFGAIEDGVRVHEGHGWGIALARAARKLALWMLVSAAVALLVWGAMALLSR